MSSHNILVVGTGAIGAFFASRLSLIPGVSVSVVCRSNYDSVKEQGIRVISPSLGDVSLKPVQTFASLEEAAQAKNSKTLWDYLLVTTKVLPELGDPSELLEGIADEQSSIVLIQNGLGIEQPYHARFPRSPIISVTTRTSVAQQAPSVFKHFQWTRTTLGPFSPTSDDAALRSKATERTDTFASLLESAGIEDLDLLDHIEMQFARWHKTAINAALNPTSVLAGGASNQALALDDETLEHMRAVMEEMLNAASVILAAPVPKSLPTIDAVLQGVKDDKSGSKSSMWSDWAAGRKVELEAILGNPLSQARTFGMQLPRVQSMYAMLKMLQHLRAGGT